MKRLMAVVAALPIAAFAQGMGQPRGEPPQAGQGPGAARGAPARPSAEQVQQHQRRARLALTLGLAVALDLDDARALKLGDTVAKFEERRRGVHDQLRDAQQTLRRAARGEKVSASEVDQAIAKGLDARAQLQAIDRELIGAVTKDLSPEKKARAVLFLGKYQSRFGRSGPGTMHHGPGMMMRGPGGPHGGPGGPGLRTRDRAGTDLEPGPGALACGPDCDWDDEE